MIVTSSSGGAAGGGPAKPSAALDGAKTHRRQAAFYGLWSTTGPQALQRNLGVERVLDRDNFMDAENARDRGLIERVISSHSDAGLLPSGPGRTAAGRDG